MFRIVLVQPEIPPNTGNAIRLAANTGCELHLIEPLGFSMDDRLLKRAGLDYHEHARVQRHTSFQAWIEACRPDPSRCFAMTSRGDAAFAQMQWREGDCFVFGRESSGLPTDAAEWFAPGQRVRLPMLPGQRSLNLSNAVAVVVFEAWRQQGFRGAV